jgi:hypothetical protein
VTSAPAAGLLVVPLVTVPVMFWAEAKEEKTVAATMINTIFLMVIELDCVLCIRVRLQSCRSEQLKRSGL